MKVGHPAAVGVYPDCPHVVRAVNVGGLGKHELLEQLRRAGVELNEAGRVLFAHDGFTTHDQASRLTTIELSVANLGCSTGANMAHIHERAARLGLSLCPLELGPHLRLQYLDQAEGATGQPPSRHRAPPGSLTVASPALAPDDETPKGFYLRRMEGVLWLRGYRSGPEHLWSPEDRLVFCLPQNAALNRA